MAEPLEVRVYGDPKPEPRPRRVALRGSGKLMVIVPRTADAWKRAVREAVGSDPRLRGARGPYFAPGVPVALELDFWMPRPAGHYVARDRARALRADAPEWHTNAGDVDNHSKAGMDALGAWPRGKGRPILWADDGQVAALRVSKRYETPENPPGCLVRARELCGIIGA